MTLVRPHPSVQGVITPLFTPFHEDGRLDTQGLGNLVRHLVRGGKVSSVFVRSGLGQMWLYSRDDFGAAVSTVVEAAEGHVSVFVGASGLWDGELAHRPDPQEYTDQSRDLARWSVRLGAHALVLMVPFMLAPEGPEGAPAQGVPEEVAAEVTATYLGAVAQETELPLLLYQAPSVPKDFCITPALLQELLKSQKQLVGMKLSSRRLEAFEGLLSVAKGTGFGLICGDEHVTMAAYQAGCCGIIGEGSDTYPALLAAIRERLLAGDEEGALRAQTAVLRCLEAVSGLDAAIVGKQLLQRQGVDLQPFGRNRPHPYSAETVTKLQQAQRAAFEYAGVASPYGDGSLGR
ncbi:MAG TPA: dihydrodipicolinate synthase family protein [Armatimonadota bacterium]|jgi:4-hydroxy-tetrahydrodipicolinate synthase